MQHFLTVDTLRQANYLSINNIIKYYVIIY